MGIGLNRTATPAGAGWVMLMRLFYPMLAVIAGLLVFMLALEYELLTSGDLGRSERKRMQLEELVVVGGILSLALALLAWLGHRGQRIERARRTEAEQAAHVSASYDLLTGLANRRLFAARVEEALRAGRRCAVLFIDLDRFKPVNDTHGHAAGDRVLVEIARRLRACAREPDHVARLGGDEFALLLELRHGDEDPTGLSARRVLKALEEPIDIAGPMVSVGGTIGIAIGPDMGADAAQLIHAADCAMYEAKRNRRGTIRLFAA